MDFGEADQASIRLSAKLSKVLRGHGIVLDVTKQLYVTRGPHLAGGKQATLAVNEIPPLAHKDALRPLLKWAGGKRWLVPHLMPVWANHREKRFVEPFAGGLSISLGLRPKRALLNDVNPHTINFYRWVQRGLEFTIPMKNESEFYYEMRARFNSYVGTKKARSQEAAQLFFYLNHTCYNGLCRFNRSGEFNVPFGRRKTVNFERDLAKYRDALAAWEFSIKSFEDLELKSNDFVYADPPYDDAFSDYAKAGFPYNKHVELAEKLAKHDGPVIISNHDTPRIRELYTRLKFRIEPIRARRFISCTGDRSFVDEVLATKHL